MKWEGMDKVREALAELVAATDPRGDTPVEGWKSAWRKAREALSSQPAEPVELGDRFMEILRAIHGDMPDDFADSARLAFVHATKVTQPAPSVPAVPEFCCEHAWSAAKQLAWKERDLSCDCDHNEYCQKCFPLEFRAGGKWDKYAAAPHPAAKGAEL